MSYERSVTASVPQPARGRRWLAAALLEAPDLSGQPGAWKVIEAVPGRLEDDGTPTGEVPDTISSRHAEHASGWYRLQWYDDGQNSSFSKPVRLPVEGSAGSRWN